MGMFIPSRTRTPRQFSYEPRHYDPKKEERLRQRIQVKRKAGSRRSPAGLVYFLLLLALVVFAMVTL